MRCAKNLNPADMDLNGWGHSMGNAQAMGFILRTGLDNY